MLSRKKDSIKMDDFQGFSSFSGTLFKFSIKIDLLALSFAKSFSLVLLRPAETSLILWLH